MRDNAVGLSGLEFSLSLPSRSLRSCFEVPEPPVLFNMHINKTARMSCRLIISTLHPFFFPHSEREGGEKDGFGSMPEKNFLFLASRKAMMSRKLIVYFPSG